MLSLTTVLMFVLAPHSMAKETDTESPIGGVGGAVHADPFTGTATMSIPIEVPPGRNGVQPNLALTYVSTNGNGWVGAGWKLEMGEIERSTRFGVDYTKNDYTIRLNGVSADLIQAPAPASSDEYRAKLEGGFLRIKKVSGGGWEVTDTKGTKYVFGTTVATRVADPADVNRVVKWCLERVEDRDGNFMTITYTLDQGQGYLEQVQYTGNGTTLPTNTIKFYKETRTDASDMYTSNFRTRTAFRLKTIEVKANENLVRVYKLEYDSGSEVSILKTVQQFGRDASVGTSGGVTGGTAMPAFAITYPLGTASFAGPSGVVGMYGSGWQMGDVNGDGKADLVDASQVYLSTGNGWSAAGSWGLSPYGTPAKLLVGDINGDGKADVVWSYLEGGGSDMITQFQLSTTTAPNSLTIANGFGSTTTITLTPSNQHTGTAMPFPFSTVSSIVTTDGNGNTSTTSYTFSGAYYHQAERDFRGFNYAKVTGPVGPNGEQAISETWFHQGNDVAVGVNNPAVANGYAKGLPYRTKVTDATGRVWSDTTTTYVADSDGIAPFFSPVAQVDALIDNGTKQTRTVYASYDVYGNVLREDQSGDLSTTADDRTVVRTFANNTTDWLIGFPISETVYQGIGLSPQVAQTTLYYDGTTSCSTASTNQSPTKGHLTRTVRWLNGGTNPETRMAYDAMGNLLCTRDANGNTTTLTYDSANTFAKTVSNALGHVTTTQYYGVDGVLMDKGLYGQIKSVTDPNGQVVATEYDAVGRKTKVTSPDGLITTLSYNYGTGFTVGTQHVLTSTSGAGLVTTLTSATYFDGLGRSIRQETTGPDSKTVVTEVQYDSRGAVRKKSLPYFKTLESVAGRWATTSYDALGRVVRMDSPDGTRRLSCYSNWVIVGIDAADHRKRETKDAYGRTVRVDEYQGTFSSCDTTVGTPYATWPAASLVDTILRFCSLPFELHGTEVS
ncbi:MAG TPA: SpvB/TcaC N-terminal domain-containing protein [Nitrospira sp.]|nr:SpvB/TcaC N-terminal domain-containing protein [Nitrospira sp.]